jgi:Cu(I)/Ag(I) efflux system protein CusF
MKTWIPLLAALAFVTPSHAEPVEPPAVQTDAMSDGVVRRIDVANAKITLKHGPIANLDMPPMTMVFRVQPPGLLNAVKVGDTVKFRAEDRNGALTVTEIQVLP